MNKHGIYLSNGEFFKYEGGIGKQFNGKKTVSADKNLHMSTPILMTILDNGRKRGL